MFNVTICFITPSSISQNANFTVRYFLYFNISRENESIEAKSYATAKEVVCEEAISVFIPEGPSLPEVIFVVFVSHVRNGPAMNHSAFSVHLPMCNLS